MADPDPRRVRCPSCGALPGLDCVQINTQALMIHVHVSRQVAADKLFGGENL